MKTDFYYDNAKKLLDNSRCEVVLLSANRLILKSADNPYKFRQNSSFWYYCGVNEPNCILVISSSDYFIILPKYGRTQEIMDGKTGDFLPKTENEKIKFLSNTLGWEKLDKLLTSSKKIGMLLPSKIKSPLEQSNDASTRLYAKVRKRFKTKNLFDIRKLIINQRVIKNEYELKKLQLAMNITKQAFNFVSSRIKEYKSENQIEADFTQYFISQNVNHAYNPIISSGKNVWNIHYQHNDQRLKKPTYIIMDVGAEVDYYAADITRTFYLGEPTNFVKDIHTAVEKLQKFAISQIKPGLSWLDYELSMEEKAGKILKSLGLIDEISRPNIRRFYPHGTSHFLGLDVHDVGDYSQPMRENMVITIEPGLYSKKHGFGVRIEDDFLITDKGVKNLTGDLSIKMR